MRAALVSFLMPGLLAVVFLGVAFFGSVYTWASMSLAAFLFFLWFLHPHILLEFRRLPRFFLVSLLALLIWIGVQMLWIASNGHTALEHGLWWLATVIGFLCLLTLPRHTVEQFWIVLVLLGLAEIAYGFHQVWSHHEFVLWTHKKAHWGFITGTYFNRNNLAGLLELTLGIHIGLLLKAIWERRSFSIVFYGVLLPVMLGALLQTGSRMGLLSFGVAFTVMSLFLIGKGEKLTAFFIVILFILSGGLLWWARDLILQRLDELVEQWVTLDGRLIAWSNVMHLIGDHWAKGTGLGNFRWIFPFYQPGELAWEWDHAHNDYLELAAELGVLGFFVFALAMAFLMLVVFVRFFQTERQYFPLVWGGLIGLLAFLLHSMTDFNFAIPINSLIWFWVLASALRFAQPQRQGLPHKHFVIRGTMTSVEMPRWASGTVRVLALLLCLLAAQKAWAGVWYYRGYQAFQDKNYRAATQAYEKIGGWEAGNPGWAYNQGLAAWELAAQEKNPAWYKLAAHHFERVTEKMPVYGRAWLYLALSRLGYYETSRKGWLQPEEWLEIKALIQRANTLEKESAWMSYMSGIHMMRHADHLSEEEKSGAMARIRRGVSMSPSGYLQPALGFLWESFQDWEMLKNITPENFASYKQLIEFLASRGLWKKIMEIYPVYFKLQEKDYDIHSSRGEILLENLDYARAKEAFEMAFWINQKKIRARAGILIAREALDQLPKDYRTILREVLENEEEEIGHLTFGLAKVTERTQEPYLQGLWAYRVNKIDEAVTWLEKAKSAGKGHRRYLADSYERLGRRADAIQTLLPVLDEKEPDLRDVILLQSWDTSLQGQAAAVIEKIATVHKPERAWWGENMNGSKLDRYGKVGMVVNFMPGRQLITLNVRCFPNDAGEQGVLIVRLQEQVIGTAYVNDSDWYKIVLPVTVSGGRRWLEIEYLNGMTEKDGRSGTIVFLGDLEIN